MYILKDGECVANFTFWVEYNGWNKELIHNIPESSIIKKMIVDNKEIDFYNKYQFPSFPWIHKVYFLMDVSNSVSLSSMFYGQYNIEKIYFTKNFNTSNVKFMNSMFYGAYSLQSADLSNLDTSNVITMDNMFYGCKAITYINLSGLANPKLTDISQMFEGCVNLEVINLTNFNTHNVIDMSNLFYEDESLKSIDVSILIHPK